MGFLSVYHSCGLLFDFRPNGFSITSLIPVAFLSVSHSCGLLFDFWLLASLSLSYSQWRFSLSLTPVGYSLTFGFWLLSHFLTPSGVSLCLSLLWVTLFFDSQPLGFSLTSLIPLGFLSVSHSCWLLFDFRPIGFSLTFLLPVMFLSVSHFSDNFPLPFSSSMNSSSISRCCGFLFAF